MSPDSQITERVPAGISPADLIPGSCIDLETKNRHYLVECLGDNKLRISGHPEYCLHPVPARLYGSIGNSGEMQFGRIAPGSKVMFFLEGDRPLTTSRVVSIHVELQPGAPTV